MLSKVKTIWKYGIVFGETKRDIEKFEREVDTVIWRGELEKMPDSYAKTVVEIHPNFEKYYAAAMMPLYKTYGKNKKGTENPRYAIESLKQGKENQIEMPYILIWKIIE
jgi:hypothetical protein